MFYRQFSFVSLMLMASAMLVQAAEDGFVPLFDGKTITGWKNAYEWGTVEIKDSEIHLTGEKKFFVCTEKSYSDFIFEGDSQITNVFFVILIF